MTSKWKPNGHTVRVRTSSGDLVATLALPLSLDDLVQLGETLEEIYGPGLIVKGAAGA